jgi:16S rRNA (uracil1498-N3)-methyltransferase
VHRFFIETGDFTKPNLKIYGSVARQITRVLRLKVGDNIVLLDNVGWEYTVAVEDVTASEVSCRVLDRHLGDGEPSIKLTLCQALLKGGKLETVWQKGTELGISTFIPMVSSRTVNRGNGNSTDSKHERWRKVISEAAEQSGRSLIPNICPIESFQEAIVKSAGARLVAWEEEAFQVNGGQSLKAYLLDNIDKITRDGLSIFVGPEGGFDRDEIEHAWELGVASVSLGRRILRAETAGLAMAAAVMYQLGELGD